MSHLEAGAKSTVCKENISSSHWELSQQSLEDSQSFQEDKEYFPGNGSKPFDKLSSLKGKERLGKILIYLVMMDLASSSRKTHVCIYTYIHIHAIKPAVMILRAKVIDFLEGFN